MMKLKVASGQSRAEDFGQGHPRDLANWPYRPGRGELWVPANELSWAVSELGDYSAVEVWRKDMEDDDAELIIYAYKKNGIIWWELPNRDSRRRRNKPGMAELLLKLETEGTHDEYNLYVVDKLHDWR